MLNQLFKSVLDQDRAPVVLCDREHQIVYMNPSAVKAYGSLTGRSIKACHPPAANEKIDRVVDWFLKSRDNNMVHTFYNEKENKDVYMVALRNEAGDFIGYYEKHEYRNRETAELYQLG